ncbi:MAG: hypothetical protein PHG23_03725, partial [Candidatus Pacebacteria bacterium]|nr:hypothetical protein [Candidatus Paceibacterota bacterium]
ETMMGGNTITIWQASVDDAPCNKPLVIKWQGVTEECVVSGDDSFLPELLKLIGQMPHILAAKEQAERQRKEDFKRRKRGDKEFAGLLAEAEQLNMHMPK